MKKNISHKERILKETGLTEEEFYKKFPTQEHYQEYCNGGKMKMGKGGKIGKALQTDINLDTRNIQSAVPNAKALPTTIGLQDWTLNADPNMNMEEFYRRNPNYLLNHINQQTPDIQDINPHSLDNMNANNRQVYKLGGKLKKCDDGGQGLAKFKLDGIKDTIDSLDKTNPNLSGIGTGLSDVGNIVGNNDIGNTLKLAGSGASIGSAFGPIGTGVGAAIGGAIGVGGLVLHGLQDAGKRKTELVNQQMENKKNIINSYSQPNYGQGLPGFAIGGQMDKLNNSDLIQYNSPSHENGGQAINAGGIPVTDNSGKAEIEKDENNHNGYIYSATLGVDKEGNPTANAKEVKTTYSKLAKKINNKYGNKTDTLGERTKEFEYNNLKQKNDISIKMKEDADMTKAKTAMERVMKKYGGLIKAQNGLQLPEEPNYFNPNVQSVLNLPPQRTPSWNPWTNMEGSMINPVNLPNVNVSGVPNIPISNIPYLDNQRIGKNYNLPPNPLQLPIDNTNSSKTSPIGGTDAYPYIQGYQYNKEPGWGTNPQVTPEIPLEVMFGQEPKSSKTETPIQDNTDYAGLGLSTIAPLINFAYGTVKDNNKYYPNTKEGLARNELTQLPTEYNIDANLAQNSRDTIAQQKSTNNRTPSVSNSVNSQLLTNKLYANNQLYGTKANEENRMKGDRLKALANFDYQSGDANRREAIAREDKNLANKARREDLQLNAINTLSSNLNTKRNEKVLMDNLPLVLKYTKVDSSGKLSIDKDKITSASKEQLVILQQLIDEQKTK